jgi:plastocyanin
MKNAFACISFAALLAAGCAGQASLPAAVAPVSNQAATVALHRDGGDRVLTYTVGVRLTGEAPFNSRVYGRVLGYFNGKMSTRSEVVSLPIGQNVRFLNVDTMRPHTASFLGKATNHGANFPPSFNGSANQSPAGTAIGTTNFSTGPLNPGQRSLQYTTGLPGFYMFGCAFHYDSDGMRTVIIVH